MALYLTSLDLGLGDPRLPLLTEGSQLFRMVVPRSRAQQRRVREYYQKAMPYQIYSSGDLGVALFRPGVANLPVVLRRSVDGLWYVDEYVRTPAGWRIRRRVEEKSWVFNTPDFMKL